jgi:cytoskeletal protein CcmA (bactofilin family)
VSMWGKRRDEDAPKPQAIPIPAPPTAPKPVEPKKEATTLSSMSPTPMGRVEADSRPGLASIGKAVKIVGQIFSREDLYVDGDVEGTIELLEHKLTIGPNGKVQAGIKAREVVALGTIQGNVEAADKIEIRKEARLVGDIRTARIMIEDGAYFKGSIDIVKAEPVKPARAEQRSHAAPAAPTPAPAPTPAAAPAPAAVPAGGAEVKR